jgi:RsmE family RNA methyltransferase
VNLILLFPDDFVDTNRVRLTGRRHAHVCTVQRAEVGTELRVGLLNDRVGRGRVTALTATALEMEVALAEPPPAPLPVSLLLALPRPKSLKRLLQAVTAMGVKRLTLVNSWRVEKSYWLSPTLEAGMVREHMILGLEQERDTVLPEVSLRRRFKPFVEDEVPRLIEGTVALAAHPAAPEACPRNVQQPVTLAVGPEGGFTPYEVELLCRQGFRAVTLGPRPLRVEQAIAALLGRLF